MKEELEFKRHMHSTQRAQLEQRHEGMKKHRVAKELGAVCYCCWVLCSNIREEHGKVDTARVR